MSKTALTSQNAPRPAGAYSQGIVANGFLYTAGFGPQDPMTGQFAANDIRAQVHQVLRNIEAILRECGLGLGDVVKATVHLQDLRRDFADFNEVYLELMPQPYPVRTTVGSDLAGILVEIDVVAALPGTGESRGCIAEMPESPSPRSATPSSAKGDRSPTPTVSP